MVCCIFAKPSAMAVLISITTACVAVVVAVVVGGKHKACKCKSIDY